MSVEPAVLTALVEKGKSGLKQLYREALTADDFIVYREEYDWIDHRLSAHHIVNPRIFRQRFPDFDWTSSTEPISELLATLKNERIFTEARVLVESMAYQLNVENAREIVEQAREEIAKIARLHNPHSDSLMEGDVETQIKEMRAGLLLAKNGKPVGISTGIAHLDFHWGGLLPGRMYVMLGRPGSGKSFLIDKFVWEAKKAGLTAGLFSPEMNLHEHRCRIHTLASAEKEIQDELGLKKSFRNRALMERRGFNIKHYTRFLRYIEQMPGKMHLLSSIHRGTKMTVQYIESRIDDLGLDVVFIDPIYKLRSVRKRGSQWEELGELADAVQDLAESRNIPVVITNQAHRQGGASGDAPHKDRSFGSDVPIQEADHVLGVLHISEENLLKLRCTKSRFGQDFDVAVRFFANTGVMRPLTPLPSHSYLNGSDNPTDDEMNQIMVAAQRALEEV